MRTVVVGLVVALAAVAAAARAERVMIREPLVVRACRRETSWPRITACLAKLGRVTSERTLGNAQLVRVTSRDSDLGVYLYLRDPSGWHLGGMYAPGIDYQVLALAPVRDHGYRIDVATRTRETSRSLVTRGRQAVICEGESYRCTEVTTSCEIVEDGRTAWLFQGALRFEPADHAIYVDGDRRLGAACAPPERVF